MSDRPVTAKASSLVGCMRCARVWPQGHASCGRCGARLKSRSDDSLVKVWLWWGLGVLAYIPANLFPLLETRVLFSKSEDTILSGVITLASHGAWGVAAIIVLVSVVIPLVKFAAIAYLARAVARGRPLVAAWKTRVFHFVEFIGRWSMVDVFVVAILSSLVQFSLIATIRPGAGAVAFGLSVIFTMLSAQSLDPRLFWDLDETCTPNRTSATA